MLTFGLNNLACSREFFERGLGTRREEENIPILVPHVDALLQAGFIPGWMTI